MHYVTRRSYRMQKHKFGVTYPDANFVESVAIPPEHENSALLFHNPDAPECTS
jgi:hypothetical protein